MLRLSDDGRVPAAGPLSGVSAHPLGFTWHPSTNELWAVFPGQNGEAMLRSIAGGHTAVAERVGLWTTAGGLRSSGALVVQPAAVTTLLPLVRALVAAAPENGAPRTVRLTVPVLVGNELNGVLDLVGDAVAGNGGTLFLATNNAGRTGNAEAVAEDVIVRLTPRPR